MDKTEVKTAIYDSLENDSVSQLVIFVWFIQ